MVAISAQANHPLLICIYPKQKPLYVFAVATRKATVKWRLLCANFFVNTDQRDGLKVCYAF